MSEFTVRVQLQDHRPGDYEELHQKMEDAGFARYVVDAVGNRFRLPDAEYDFEAPMSVKDVRDLAKQIADSVRPRSLILVTELGVRSWHLKKLE